MKRPPTNGLSPYEEERVQVRSVLGGLRRAPPHGSSGSLGHCATPANPMRLTLQDSINRAAFYSKNLGSFGVPLIQALTPHGPMKVTFEGQSFDLGSPADEEESDPFEDGFSSPRCWAEGCLGWIWCQWLSQAPPETIRKEVQPLN